MKRMKALVRGAIGFLLRMLLVFVAVEGVCSALVMGCKFSRIGGRPHAGGSNAMFDAELGWVNLPNLRIKDPFQGGGSLTTNARGFRSVTETAVAVPPNKVRVLCSGDSFTFGFGTSDEDNLCQQLEAQDPRIDAVNLGVAGYGIDQSFLLYRRDGLKLDHDIHLLSFIKDDFKRMTLYKSMGANKPVIRLDHGALSVDNVPLRKEGFSLPTITWAKEVLEEARFFTLYGLIRGRPRERVAYGGNDEMMQTALSVLDEARRLSAGKNAVFVAAYLPMWEDLEDMPGMQSYLRAELDKRGIPFVDLTEDFKRLPPAERLRMYIEWTPKSPPLAAGHYSAAGARLAAKAIHRALMAIPAAAAKLGPSEPRP